VIAEAYFALLPPEFRWENVGRAYGALGMGLIMLGGLKTHSGRYLMIRRVAQIKKMVVSVEFPKFSNDKFRANREIRGFSLRSFIRCLSCHYQN
jgi:hypothetical protein